MRLQLRSKTASRVHGQMKLARLLEAPETELERRIRALESGALFGRLLESGVVVRQVPEHMRFSGRRFAGRALRASSEGLPELVDGTGDLAKLMQNIGQEDFSAAFLGDDGRSDAERAELCGISTADARRLRDLVDRLYVQEQFEAPAPKVAPEPTLSALAGIAIEDGKPVLCFFHREIWDRHYLINDERRRDLALDLPARDAKRAETLLRELEYIDQRKTTLYRVLEAVLETQADYLVSGDAERRVPLTQKALSDRLDISPSVLNRLIANKSVELPWGLEASLSVFVPSRKSLLRDQLHDLALARPELSDEGLRTALLERNGVELSRRSIAQYRKELGVGAINRRHIQIGINIDYKKVRARDRNKDLPRNRSKYPRTGPASRID